METRSTIEQIEQYIPQKELAKKMGVLPRTIRKWKSGYRKPNAANMEKLNRISGGYRGMGKKLPIYRKRRMVKDIYGEPRLSQMSGAEGDLEGFVDAPDTDVFLSEVLEILQNGFYGEAYARFRTIYKWMQYGNLYSGIQIGVMFDIRYADKLMGDMVERKGVTMFSRSKPPGPWDYRDELNDLIDNLIDNFNKWLSQSPLDFLEITFRKWYIVSYRYKGG